jgi:spore germination protein GerM
MDNSSKGLNRKTVFGIAFLILLFLAGGTGGYFYFSKVMPRENGDLEGVGGPVIKTEDLFSLRIYYPVGNQLQIEEKKLPRRIGQMAIAEATVEEYLRGPLNASLSYIPKNTKVIDLYMGMDKICYVNLSDEFRRNFQGDVFVEFLLLKGLYESLISNVEDVQDIKVLIEGKEIETLGGHLYLSHPLKDLVSYDY